MSLLTSKTVADDVDVEVSRSPFFVGLLCIYHILVIMYVHVCTYAACVWCTHLLAMP